jgi:methylenetetrahydrofolate dehydrogenase (NADP+)/methenyltetrahydrofolate cyclohydrolase
LLWDPSAFVPCTPAWIMKILEEQKVELEWKIVTVIWRSSIVWKPVISLLINAWATVICCNSKTKNLDKFTTQADIIITATWKPWLLKVNMVKVWAIVIDVWFTVIDWKIYWDADTKLINLVWWKITPVPWWVWAITVAMLMKNTLKAYNLQNK